MEESLEEPMSYIDRIDTLLVSIRKMKEMEDVLKSLITKIIYSDDEISVYLTLKSFIQLASHEHNYYFDETFEKSFLIGDYERRFNDFTKIYQKEIDMCRKIVSLNDITIVTSFLLCVIKSLSKTNVIADDASSTHKNWCETYGYIKSDELRKKYDDYNHVTDEMIEEYKYIMTLDIRELFDDSYESDERSAQMYADYFNQNASETTSELTELFKNVIGKLAENVKEKPNTTETSFDIDEVDDL